MAIAQFGPPLVAMLGLLLVWSVVSISGLVSAFFLPNPVAVLKAGYDALISGSLVTNLAISSGRILIAFGVSVVLAVPTAVAICRTTNIGRGLESVIDFFRYIPVPALIPISIVFFGVGENEKIFLLFAGTYFQVVVLIVDSFRRIPQEYFDMFYSLKLREREVNVHMLRAAAPDIFDICRVALGWCWSYVVLAEVIGAQSGVGHALELAHRLSNTAAVYLWMIVLALVGLVTDLLFRNASRLIFKFRDVAATVPQPSQAAFSR